MTDAKNQQAEPSMEEILASIRRIISEDTDGAKAQPAAASAPSADETPPPPKASEPAPAPKAAEPPPAAPAPEILELTELVGDDGNVTNLGDDKPSEPAARPAEPAASPAEPAPIDDDERLVSQRAASAAAGALSGLQAATRRPETPRGLMGLGNGGTTLEEIVRAEMRPILKAWLDEHLPPLVERLVQKEIKRITRQVED